METKNPFACLFERLSSNTVKFVEGDLFPIHLSKQAVIDFRKARLIVEELSKVPWTDSPNSIVGAVPCDDYLRATLIKCRAIAEGKEIK